MSKSEFDFAQRLKFAKNIERAIGRTWGSKADLARSLDISGDTVYAWCNARRVPSIAMLVQLLDATGATPNELFEGLYE